MLTECVRRDIVRLWWRVQVLCAFHRQLLCSLDVNIVYRAVMLYQTFKRTYNYDKKADTFMYSLSTIIFQVYLLFRPVMA